MEIQELKKSESRIQSEIVQWYRNTYCLLHHNPRCLIISIPNEGNPFLFQTGALPGTSDLYIQHNQLNNPMRILWVECKSLTGKQTEKQKNFQKFIKQLGNPNEYHLIRCLEEFKNLIINNG